MCAEIEEGEYPVCPFCPEDDPCDKPNCPYTIAREEHLRKSSREKSKAS